MGKYKVIEDIVEAQLKIIREETIDEVLNLMKNRLKNAKRCAGYKGILKELIVQIEDLK